MLKVIVEKPVGMSLRELEKMKETAEKYNAIMVSSIVDSGAAFFRSTCS
jgi:predicted dehydrogenase